MWCERISFNCSWIWIKLAKLVIQMKKRLPQVVWPSQKPLYMHWVRSNAPHKLACFILLGSIPLHQPFQLRCSKFRGIQDYKRLQDEIDSTLSKYDNVISYDNLNEMPFLDNCIKGTICHLICWTFVQYVEWLFFLETIREYPTLPYLHRVCTKEYTVENLGLTIPKGTPVVISLLGLMRDAKYFPEPDRYWPERYSKNNPKYDPEALIPFGDGPRSCIGTNYYHRSHSTEDKLKINDQITDFIW